MPNYTPNYNLKKPLPNENYNIQDFNDNADIIDQKLKEIEDNVENIEVPVTSINGKTGDVELTAADVGAETPAGAQAKADTAEQNAKAYADNKVGNLSSLNTDSKDNLVSSINELFTSVSNGKSLIATAITDKGVITNGSDTFETMANNIRSISINAIKSVQRGIVSPSGKLFDIPINTVDPDYTIALVENSAPNTDNYIQYLSAHPIIVDSNTLQLDCNQNSSGLLGEYSWQVIEFNPEAIESLQKVRGGNVLSIQTVNVNKTVLFHTNLGSPVGTPNKAWSMCYAYLSSSNSINVVGNSTHDNYIYVVEFK